jgi:hypothetical protein
MNPRLLGYFSVGLEHFTVQVLKLLDSGCVVL